MLTTTLGCDITRFLLQIVSAQALCSEPQAPAMAAPGLCLACPACWTAIHRTCVDRDRIKVMKTQGKEMEKGGEYRQMLVRGIHHCAVKFPDVANNVVHLLMDFLGDTVGVGGHCTGVVGMP